MVAKRALAVSIGRYANPRHNLPGLDRDVEAFNKLATSFEFHNIEFLRDSAATRKGLIEALNRLVDDCYPGDIALFYYTGHGYRFKTDETGDYSEALVTYEAKTSSLLSDKWINSFLRRRLRPDVTLYAIYDACHGGEMYKEFSFDESSQVGDQEGDEIAKFISYGDLNFDGPPTETMNIHDSSKAFLKSFGADNDLINSVHFGAAQEDEKALVKNIEVSEGNFERRSVFTWALEAGVEPGMTVGEVEERVSDLVAQVTSRHSPNLSTTPNNKSRQFLAPLV